MKVERRRKEKRSKERVEPTSFSGSKNLEGGVMSEIQSLDTSFFV